MAAYLNRFISPDNIVPDFANPQSLNRYSYVYNNPHKYVDPDGHIAILATMAIGAVGSAELTTVTYLVTTPQDEWDAGEVALVAGAGAGAVGGALIGISWLLQRR